MLGPGKYDSYATHVRESTSARGVVMAVLGGNQGDGFTVQATGDVLVLLPAILRDMADKIESDSKQTERSN